MRGSPKKGRVGLLGIACLGLLAMVSLGGCNKANIIYGQSQVDYGFTNVVQLDSITPVMSTLFVDSIPSSAKGIIFAGSYNDPAFGNINTRSYVEFAPPAYQYLPQGTVFDSMTLYLIPNKYYYGDTTVPVDIYANKVQYLMQYPINTGEFYSNDSFPVNYYLGHVHQLIRPSFPDTVYMHMDSTLGAEFFNLYNEQALSMSNITQFLQYFPGIQLSSGSGAANIYGFKDTCLIKVWYHNIYSGPHSIGAIQFRYTNKGYQFNEIRNTPIAPLNSFPHSYSSVVRQIYSTDPAFQHTAYMNSLLGYVVKFEFPGLRGLYQADSNFVRILKAELVTRPIPNSFSYQLQVPTTMQLYATNYYNEPGSAVATGILNLDYYSPSTQYSFDITSYLLSEIQNPSGTYTGDGLILQPTSTYYTQFNRLVLGDKEFLSPYTSSQYYQTQLILYYVSVRNTL